MTATADPPPDEDFAEIVRRVAPRPDAAPPPPGLWDSARTALHRVAAALRFDSAAATPQGSGMRSAGATDATDAAEADGRHLLFSAKGRDIDLRVASAGRTWTLSGQVLGPDERGTVHLATQARGAPPSRAWAAATLDDLGEFHVDGLVDGTYLVTLQVEGEAIELPPIDIGRVAR